MCNVGLAEFHRQFLGTLNVDKIETQPQSLDSVLSPRRLELSVLESQLSMLSSLDGSQL